MMSPILYLAEQGAALARRVQGPDVAKPTDAHGLILEAWAQGFMVGSLVIMSCVTLANMRRGVLLHKLILVELIFGIWHGFFIFFESPIYNWWLSISAIFLNVSWSLHNVIAWLKIKPFLSRRVSLFFIGTVILVQPYWVLEIYANFSFFHNIDRIFEKTRPLEALFRDPWWIFTTISLFYNIRNRYELSLPQIVRLSPRCAVMLGAMVLSICFLIIDICSVTGALTSSLPVGINPFWKLSFVFKCLTDSVVLEDFKTALDRLSAFKMGRFGSFAAENGENGPPPPFHSGPPPPFHPSHGWLGLHLPSETEMRLQTPDRDHLTHPSLESTGKPEVDHIESPKRGHRRMSQTTGSSSEVGIEADKIDTPVIRPQSSWPRNSTDVDYAQALREVTRSSHSDGSHSERDIAIGRAS